VAVMSSLISNKNPFSMMTILFAIHPYGSDTIIPEPLKYSVFHSGDTAIKLSLLW